MTDAEWMIAVMEWHVREYAAFAEQWERRSVEMAAFWLKTIEAQKTAEQQGPESP